LDDFGYSLQHKLAACFEAAGLPVKPVESSPTTLTTTMTRIIHNPIQMIITTM